MTTKGMRASWSLRHWSMTWCSARFVGLTLSKRSPLWSTTSTRSAMARSTTRRKASKKSCSLALRPSGVTRLYAANPTWVSLTWRSLTGALLLPGRLRRGNSWISESRNLRFRKGLIRRSGDSRLPRRRRPASVEILPWGHPHRGRHLGDARGLGEPLDVVLVEVDLRGDGEGRVGGGDEHLAGHQRLDLVLQAGDVLLGAVLERLAVLLVGEAHDEEGVELGEALAVDELGLLRDGAEARLELAAFAADAREDVGSGGLAQDALRLLQRDEHGRKLVEGGLAEGGLVGVEHGAGEDAGDEKLLLVGEAARVDEDHLARVKLGDDAAAHGDLLVAVDEARAEEALDA